jgi:hypothetical protein
MAAEWAREFHPEGRLDPWAPRMPAESKAENSRLLRAEIAGGRTAYRGLPEIVTLNSTDICNLRCVMCPRSLAQGKCRLDDRAAGLVCDELFSTALKVNRTTAGGEPLRRGFDGILERARRHAVRMDVATDGMLLDLEVFPRMRPVLDHLNFGRRLRHGGLRADPRGRRFRAVRLGGSFRFAPPRHPERVGTMGVIHAVAP